MWLWREWLEGWFAGFDELASGTCERLQVGHGDALMVHKAGALLFSSARLRLHTLCLKQTGLTDTSDRF